MNGLKHFVPGNVKPKFQIVEVFIKVRLEPYLISNCMNIRSHMNLLH
jgi:hypothetical protein